MSSPAVLKPPTALGHEDSQEVGVPGMPMRELMETDTEGVRPSVTACLWPLRGQVLLALWVD